MSQTQTSTPAPGLTINPPELYDFSKPDQWEKWFRRFNRYRSASGLNVKPDEVQIGTLIYCMGDQAEDILSTFELSEEDAKVYKTVSDRFNSHFVADRNIIYERAKFNKRTQAEGESVDMFITNLYALAEHCKYGTLHDELVRDHLVVGCRDRRLSEKLQMHSELTLSKAVKIARQSESVKQQQEVVRNVEAEAVHVVTKSLYQKKAPGDDKKATKWKSFQQRGKPFKQRQNSGQSDSKCGRCGAFKAHPRKLCPAIRAKCLKCRKIGHFANMCGSKVVHTLKKEDLDKSSSEVDCYPFLGELTVSEVTSEAWRIKAIVDGNSLMFKIDSGADVTAIPENLYQSGNFSPLEPTALKLQGPRKSPIEVKGKMLTTISIKDKGSQQEVWVVPNLEEPLLGRPAIEKLDVLQVKANVCSLAKSRLDLYTEYKDLFEGLGEFKEQYKIELTEDAKPYLPQGESPSLRCLLLKRS